MHHSCLYLPSCHPSSCLQSCGDGLSLPNNSCFFFCVLFCFVLFFNQNAPNSHENIQMITHSCCFWLVLCVKFGIIAHVSGHLSTCSSLFLTFSSQRVIPPKQSGTTSWYTISLNSTHVDHLPKPPAMGFKQVNTAECIVNFMSHWISTIPDQTGPVRRAKTGLDHH